jgi:hypothetical protein
LRWEPTVQLVAAQASDPSNLYVKANLQLLEESSRKGKGIE